MGKLILGDGMTIDCTSAAEFGGVLWINIPDISFGEAYLIFSDAEKTDLMTYVFYGEEETFSHYTKLFQITNYSDYTKIALEVVK